MHFELQRESVSAFLSQDFTSVPSCAAVQSFVARWFSRAPIWQRSTGKPKIFELDRAATHAEAHMSYAHFGLQAGDTALLCLSVEYIAGKMMVVRALEGGLQLFLTPLQVNSLAELEEVVDFAAMVPAQLQAALPELERVPRLRCRGKPGVVGLRMA